MNTFIMTCGLPSSGKSTWVESQNDFTVHSSDALRKELYGNINCQDKNGELFQELHKRIRTDLSKGKNVIYDATNISYKRRMDFLRQINFINCEKVCYLFATPYEDCVERDSERKRSVGEEIIKRMYKNFYVPQKYEGWNSIKVIWNYKESNFNIDDLCDELDKIDQETPYHTLTIGDHNNQCYMRLKPLILDKSLEEHFKLLVVAFLHDIGKKFCKEFNDEKGYCTYYQHHLVGSYNSMFYLKNAGYRDDEILDMCNYIQWHMQPFFIKEEKTKDKFIRLVGKEFYDNLMLLHEADVRAK